MDRMHTLEYVTDAINKSKELNKNEKKHRIQTYKTLYFEWLESLKRRMNTYQPLFEDLDIRRNLSPSFNYSESNLKDEIWKTFPLNRQYTVSNLGRIKFNGKIQKQKEEKAQYIKLADESLRQDYVYNFVAYTFLGKKENDGYHVHHITNDGYYNTEDNLVLLTPEEHSYVHGFKVGY